MSLVLCPWVLGLGSLVLGPWSCVLGLGSWVFSLWSLVMCPWSCVFCLWSFSYVYGLLSLVMFPWSCVLGFASLVLRNWSWVLGLVPWCCVLDFVSIVFCFLGSFSYTWSCSMVLYPWSCVNLFVYWFYGSLAFLVRHEFVVLWYVSFVVCIVCCPVSWLLFPVPSLACILCPVSYDHVFNPWFYVLDFWSCASILLDKCFVFGTFCILSTVLLVLYFTS